MSDSDTADESVSRFTRVGRGSAGNFSTARELSANRSDGFENGRKRQCVVSESDVSQHKATVLGTKHRCMRQMQTC
jgi:hypothetical protein